MLYPNYNEIEKTLKKILDSELYVSDKKYILMDKSQIMDGHTLYRIQAIRSFGFVSKGDIGGWVESEDNLSHDGNCWIYDNAMVYDNARVYNNARISGNTQTYGNAQVYGNACVLGNAIIFDAVVCDKAYVGGNTIIYGNRVIDQNVNLCMD